MAVATSSGCPLNLLEILLDRVPFCINRSAHRNRSPVRASWDRDLDQDRDRDQS